jgi:hypothetical protein
MWFMESKTVKKKKRIWNGMYSTKSLQAGNRKGRTN